MPKITKGCTILHRLVKRICVELAKLVLENGADVNARNNEGQTPFDFAKLSFNEKGSNYFSICNMILLLIKKGAEFKINAQDSQGCTLLHYAAIGGHRELAERTIREEG